MCFNLEASLAMVAAGTVATAVTARRGEPLAIWGTLGYFTVMEALQAGGYGVLGQCGDPLNRGLTQASYLHIAVQPLVINAFAMAIAPAPVPPRLARAVYALAGLATAFLLFRLLPVPALGPCLPGSTLCGPDWCLRPGSLHIAWDVPHNGFDPWWHAILGTRIQFPEYLLAVFVLPCLYGAWRFAAFHLVAGPLAAMALTRDMGEMPAIWCLFSVGIILIGLSPFIRHRVIGARIMRAA